MTTFDKGQKSNFFLGKSVSLSKRLRWIRVPTANPPSSGNSGNSGNSSKLSSKKSKHRKQVKEQKQQQKQPEYQYEYWPGLLYKNYKEIRTDVKVMNQNSEQFYKYIFLREREDQRKHQCNVLRKKTMELEQSNKKSKKNTKRKNRSASTNSRAEEEKEETYLLAVVFYGNTLSLRRFDHLNFSIQMQREQQEEEQSLLQQQQAQKEQDPSPIQSFWPNYDQHVENTTTSTSRTTAINTNQHQRHNIQKAIDIIYAMIQDEEMQNKPQDQFVIYQSYYDNGIGSCGDDGYNDEGREGGRSIESKKVISPDCIDGEVDEDEDMKEEEAESTSDNDDYEEKEENSRDIEEEEKEEVREQPQKKIKKDIARRITNDFRKEEERGECSPAENESTTASTSSTNSRNENNDDESSKSEFGDDGSIDNNDVIVHDDEVSSSNSSNSNRSCNIQEPLTESEDGESPIKRNETWAQVWEKLKAMGWFWKWTTNKIGIDERSYYFRGTSNGTKAIEVEGKRFWKESEFKMYAKKKYGWMDPDNKVLTPIEQTLPQVERKRKRSPTRSDKSKVEKGKTTKKVKSASKSKKKVNSKTTSKMGANGKARLSRQRIWGKESKAKQSTPQETPPEKMNFGWMWKYLQKKGWKWIKSKNPLHENYYYLKPNVQHDSKKVYGVEGVDYFITRDSCYDYLMNNQHYLSSPENSSCESEAETTLSVEAHSPSSKRGVDNSESYCTPNSYDDGTGDHNDEFEDEDIEGSDNWWLNVPIPTWSSDVKDIVLMMNRAKMIKMIGNNFTVSYKGKEHSLNSLTKFRQYLCSHGIDIDERNVLDEDELQTLSRWISITHLPAKVGDATLDHGTSLDILPDIPVLNDQEAWDLLCNKFNCKEENNKFYVPCLKSTSVHDNLETCFDTKENARKAIRSHGIKNMSGDEKNEVSIILWASLADVDPFVSEVVEIDLSSSPEAQQPWWYSVPFPDFKKQVWPLLKKSGIKSSCTYNANSNGKVYRFDSTKELQIFLSLKGIELEPGHNLSDDDKELISRWISIAHLPTRVNGHSLVSSTGSNELFSKDPMDSKEAWKVLCGEHYESRKENNQLHVPRMGELMHDPTPLKYFDSIEDVRKYIRSHGINRRTKIDQNLDHVRLILWASLADVNPFIEVNSDASTNKGSEKNIVEDAKTSLDHEKSSPKQKEGKKPLNNEPTVIATPTASRNMHDEEIRSTVDQSLDNEDENGADFDADEYYDHEERYKSRNQLLTQEEDLESKEKEFKEIIETMNAMPVSED